MHVLIVGGRGQLGRSLQALYATQPHVHVTVWNRPQFDITRPSVADRLADLGPDVVVNAAAWTDVDGAETQADAAYAANALGPLYLAHGCARCGARLVQVSTNEIFAGEPGRFYREYDQPAPGGVYARSKLAGEFAARESGVRLLVVRVAWLFGPGGDNFPAKISAAAARHGRLRVVADEYGNPTYAPDVAEAIAGLIQLGRCGTYHVVNEGYTSRFEFARELLHLSGRQAIPLTPIPSSEWPRPAPPPPHAVLVNQAAAALDIRLRSWQEALAAFVAADQRMNSPVPSRGDATA